MNRQISESYSTSLHNRLKSSGVPVPGVSDGLFGLNEPKMPLEGGANGASALKPSPFSAAPYPPLSDLPGFDRRATPSLDSQSVSCDEKQQQSLTSAFFPQTNTAR
ncbi:unnamed protein product [Dibothriocephalus latus]|uniref:Uncharacterized protein n=1 Tax=Dibothriocephalus latus TaxID=60516 RepID=A0A3P7MIG6_DIBLA|nr:unnamed protein product [Dibothriocephalus latus]